MEEKTTKRKCCKKTTKEEVKEPKKKCCRGKCENKQNLNKVNDIKYIIHFFQKILQKINL